MTPPRPPPSPREEFEALVDAMLHAYSRERYGVYLSARVAVFDAWDALARERDEAADRWNRDRGERSRLHPLLDGADDVLNRVREAVAAPKGESVVDACRALARRVDVAERVDAEWADFEARVMRMAASANDDGGTCSEDAINDVLSAFRALRAEVSLLTHKVITCGVAASHPDPALSRTGAYAGQWDSPQAEEVRKLREECDALARRAEETRAQAVANIDRALAAEEGWKRCAADLASETARANRAEERAEAAERERDEARALAEAETEARANAETEKEMAEAAYLRALNDQQNAEHRAESALSERTRRVDELHDALMGVLGSYDTTGQRFIPSHVIRSARAALSSSPEAPAAESVSDLITRAKRRVTALREGSRARSEAEDFLRRLRALAAPAATPDPTTKEE